MNFQLIGFVGEYADSGDSLNYFLPVIQSDAASFVAARTAWTTEDLREVDILDENHNEYLNLFAPKDYSPISEGEVVWVVGANFYNRLDTFARLRPFAQVFFRWRRFRGQYSFGQGTLADLHKFSETILDISLPLFYEALYERTGYATDDADFLSIISGLPLSTQRDVSIARAIYYHEGHDDPRFDATRFFAVKFGDFETESDFDSEFERTLDRHRSDRVSRHSRRTEQPHSAGRSLAEALTAAAPSAFSPMHLASSAGDRTTVALIQELIARTHYHNMGRGELMESELQRLIGQEL